MKQLQDTSILYYFLKYMAAFQVYQSPVFEKAVKALVEVEIVDSDSSSSSSSSHHSVEIIDQAKSTFFDLTQIGENDVEDIKK